MACQRFPDDQTLRLQTGAGEDDIIHLPSGLHRVDSERQEEEEDVQRSFKTEVVEYEVVHMNAHRSWKQATTTCTSGGRFCFLFWGLFISYVSFFSRMDIRDESALAIARAVTLTQNFISSLLSYLSHSIWWTGPTSPNTDPLTPGVR